MRTLAGIEVVSLAVNIPGPVVAARLAALGASVTKIEPPSGDPLDRHAPRWYARLTAPQRILRLDLKTREGKTALEEHLAGADLLLTASRPQALARLGLDFATLHPRLPRLCHLQIVGFGPPDEEVPGHDLTYQAAAGLLVDPPRMPVTLLADLMGAERAVAEALSLLLHRERSGEGAASRISLAEAASALSAPIALGLCAPRAELGGGRPGYAIYRTKDGWIALAALEDHFLDKLKAGLELRSVSASGLRRAFAQRTSARWEAWGRRHGVPVTKVRAPRF